MTSTSTVPPLNHPRDAMGRARWLSKIDDRAIERSADNTAGAKFHGHAIVFNRRTWIGSRSWGFWEQIAPEAVARTINADVRFLINHDPTLLLARTTSGTLRLSTDDVGLVVDADLPDISYANDLGVLLERGDMSQMSFAFEPVTWRYEVAEDGKDLYTITELNLYDVSVVTFPAYETTDAGLRALAFDALCRSASIDPSEVLRRVNDGSDLNDLLVVEQSEPAEARSGPAETTRQEDPPAETTGTRDLTHLVLRHRTVGLAIRKDHP